MRSVPFKPGEKVNEEPPKVRFDQEDDFDNRSGRGEVWRADEHAHHAPSTAPPPRPAPSRPRATPTTPRRLLGRALWEVLERRELRAYELCVVIDV